MAESDTPPQDVAAIIRQSIAALEAVEWRPHWGPGSGACYWCGGWERHPAMDQDYYGVPGHKPDCVRAAALEGLRKLLAETTKAAASS